MRIRLFVYVMTIVLCACTKYGHAGGVISSMTGSGAASEDKSKSPPRPQRDVTPDQTPGSKALVLFKEVKFRGLTLPLPKSSDESYVDGVLNAISGKIIDGYNLCRIQIIPGEKAQTHPVVQSLRGGDANLVRKPSPGSMQSCLDIVYSNIQFHGRETNQDSVATEVVDALKGLVQRYKILTRNRPVSLQGDPATHSSTMLVELTDPEQLINGNVLQLPLSERPIVLIKVWTPASSD